jgi:hypothetical protein
MEKLDFLCINCQELVSQADLYMHSVFCVYPSQTALDKENDSQLVLVLFKVGKLKDSLKKMMTKAEEGEVEIIQFLVDKISEVEQVRMDLASYESCKSTLFTLERYSQTKLSTFILIYIERLKVIIVECLQVIEKEVEEVHVNQMDVKYKEIQLAKADALNAKFNPSQNIDEISSQISRIWNFGAVSVSNPESDLVEQDEDELDSMAKANQNAMGRKNEEDLMRYFYSKCLAIKMTIPFSGAQSVQVMDLYKKAIEFKIPVEKWEEFIKEQLVAAQYKNNL